MQFIDILKIYPPALSPTYDIINMGVKFMKKIESIIEELLNLGHETKRLEFKENVNDPNMIGEYISALSNSAAIHNKEFGYLIWGIDDANHKEVGTKFDFQKDVKNEPLEHFLARQISPSIPFQFYELKPKFPIRIIHV